MLDGHKDEKTELLKLLNKKFELEKQRVKETLNDECNVKVAAAIEETKAGLREKMNEAVEDLNVNLKQI